MRLGHLWWRSWSKALRGRCVGVIDVGEVVEKLFGGEKVKARGIEGLEKERTIKENVVSLVAVSKLCGLSP